VRCLASFLLLYVMDFLLEQWKKWLKLMYIYGSYCSMKSGVLPCLPHSVYLCNVQEFSADPGRRWLDSLLQTPDTSGAQQVISSTVCLHSLSVFLCKVLTVNAEVFHCLYWVHCCCQWKSSFSLSCDVFFVVSMCYVRLLFDVIFGIIVLFCSVVNICLCFHF